MPFGGRHRGGPSTVSVETAVVPRLIPAARWPSLRILEIVLLIGVQKDLRAEQLAGAGCSVGPDCAKLVQSVKPSDALEHVTESIVRHR